MELSALERDRRTVFVNQLSRRLTQKKLTAFFEEDCGKVRVTKLVTDKVSGKSKGIAYVEFMEIESVPKAIAKTGEKLLGIPVVVTVTQAEKNRLAELQANGAAPSPMAVADGPRDIVIRGLHELTDSDDVKALCEPFGEVEKVKLLKLNAPEPAKSREEVPKEDAKGDGEKDSGQDDVKGDESGKEEEVEVKDGKKPNEGEDGKKPNEGEDGKKPNEGEDGKKPNEKEDKAEKLSFAVRFKVTLSAHRAIDQLNGFRFVGCQLAVKFESDIAKATAGGADAGEKPTDTEGDGGVATTTTSGNNQDAIKPKDQTCGMEMDEASMEAMMMSAMAEAPDDVEPMQTDSAPPAVGAVVPPSTGPVLPAAPVMPGMVPGMPGLGGLPGMPPVPMPGMVMMPPVAMPHLKSVVGGFKSQNIVGQQFFDAASETHVNWIVQLEDDILEECCRFGPILHLAARPSTEGMVYIRFATADAAEMCAKNFCDGRFYNKRRLSANYLTDHEFGILFKDALSNTTPMKPRTRKLAPGEKPAEAETPAVEKTPLLPSESQPPLLAAAPGLQPPASEPLIADGPKTLLAAPPTTQ